jgi:multifunctional methyltransferase subunit TRM112
VEEESAPMDAELVTKLLPKLEYSAIVAAVADIADKVENLPEIPNELPTEEAIIENPSILEALHHVLFNIHILEGDLICPDTGRKFPIKQGIPNMILHEDEI